ncbi:hypothetical protein DPMN_001898 [Dreissena polymorpha]|uniref:Uncharacterized protein n=1 Tax=Dreissena polymorpha TaxID=45954 RepID=A0A9D4MK86_DREPO|nr:hypothetical protein DPMN_001898 [Dreissena polymorpha]
MSLCFQSLADLLKVIVVDHRRFPQAGTWIEMGQQPVCVQSTLVSVMDPGPSHRRVGISVQLIAICNNPAQKGRVVVGLQVFAGKLVESVGLAHRCEILAVDVAADASELHDGLELVPPNSRDAALVLIIRYRNLTKTWVGNNTI